MLKSWILRSRNSSEFRRLQNEIAKQGLRVALCGYGVVEQGVAVNGDDSFGEPGEHVVFLNSLSDRAVKSIVGRAGLTMAAALEVDMLKRREVTIGVDGQVEFPSIPEVSFSEFVGTLPKDRVPDRFSELPENALFVYKEIEYKKSGKRFAEPLSGSLARIFPADEEVEMLL